MKSDVGLLQTAYCWANGLIIKCELIAEIEWFDPNHGINQNSFILLLNN